ncbi:MAG: sulfotransferase [Reichenbachiella sp.]|uniref:sulfotransferase n=1 Tax=Reichenbachiella sp. TaxID=2184521 RepID=UPI00329778F7
MKEKIIAIGALGGSGTRAVAELFIRLGIYMGDDLNEPNDNLLFTRLFKNPLWHQKTSIEEKNKRLELFSNYMKSGHLNLNEYIELCKASNSNAAIDTSIIYYLKKTSALWDSKKALRIWGWKEPNTQIYTEEILDFFPKLKYIHVIRHGLDMAFSNNRQQLNNWGWKYDIHLDGTENKSQLAQKQLEYWVQSTKDVLKKSEKFKSRVLILNHSNFCNNPKSEIDAILRFTEIECSEELLNELYKIPKNAGTNNRYKNKDLSIFSSEQLAFVNEMGFEID